MLLSIGDAALFHLILAITNSLHLKKRRHIQGHIAIKYWWCVQNPGILVLELVILGTPGWLSQLRIRLLILTQVMWDRAPCRAPCWVWSLFKILCPLSLYPLPLHKMNWLFLVILVIIFHVAFIFVSPAWPLPSRAVKENVWLNEITSFSTFFFQRFTTYFYILTMDKQKLK